MSETEFNYPNVKFSADPAVEGEKLPLTKTFHIEYKNPDDDTLHTGSITIKRPTLGMESMIGAVRARLAGGLAVDRHTDNLNNMIAYCEVVITESPPWLDLRECYDVKLLKALHDYIYAWECSFRRVPKQERRE